MKIVGSVKEDLAVEKRVSITPDLVKKYISQDLKVLIEKDYGAHLGFSDDIYIKDGAQIEDRSNVLKKSDIILQLNLPDEESLKNFEEKKILIGVFNSEQSKGQILSLAKKKS